MTSSSGSRRHHTKSRNGCAQCKARRVRCSCTGPVCSNCRRRKEECSYLTTGDYYAAAGSMAAGPAGDRMDTASDAGSSGASPPVLQDQKQFQSQIFGSVFAASSPANTGGLGKIVNFNSNSNSNGNTIRQDGSGSGSGTEPRVPSPSPPMSSTPSSSSIVTSAGNVPLSWHHEGIVNPKPSSLSPSPSFSSSSSSSSFSSFSSPNTTTAAAAAAADTTTTTTATCSSSSSSSSSYVPYIIPPAVYAIPIQLSFLPDSASAEERLLMTHFIENTASTLFLSPAVTSPQRWHTRVCWPTVLTSHPYVAQAVISLSALHMCHLGPPDTSRYYSAACRHFLRASKGFRETVTNMDDRTWLPTVMFSIAALVFHFYIPFAAARSAASGAAAARSPADPPEGDDGQGAATNAFSFNPLEVLFILRSSGSVLPDVGRRLRSSGLVTEDPNTIPRPSTSATDRRVSADCRRFDAVEAFIRSKAHKNVLPHERAQCLAALAHLRAWAKRIQGRPKTWRDFYGWPHLVSPGFLQQIALRSPPALAVFNQWCEVMKNGPDTWYLEPWLTKAASLPASSSSSSSSSSNTISNPESMDQCPK